jgi:hypothetical protein
MTLMTFNPFYGWLGMLLCVLLALWVTNRNHK